MNRIKYIAFTDTPNATLQRKTIPAATTKVDYIVSALNRAGYNVDIISAANALGGKWGISRTTTINLPAGNTFTSFGCISTPWKRLTQRISSRQVTNRLNRFLESSINPGDIVIAYHSPRYTKILAELRKRIEFCLIGEVEEIYQDVRSSGIEADRAEYDFFAACDKFIFPTGLLNDKLNTTGKPSILIHGLYNVERDRNVRFDDNRTHVIYAGTFDPVKGGAAAAAAAAEFLPSEFHVHILGFGTPTDTAKMQKVVEETQRKSAATVTYDGLLKGEEFIRFLQKCQIGMSTQNPDAAFNATSFPSKILTYLSNGLKVVTIDIPAVRHSDVGYHLFYYSEQTPREIAAAIIRANSANNYNGRKLLQELDEKFVRAIIEFLG